jgi:D-alanyl-D-alanine carboxypeptidase
VQLKIRNDELINGELNFTSPLNRADTLFYETVITGALIAPLPADSPAGYLVISDEYGELHRARLVTARAYARGNIFKRIWHSVLLLLQ